MNKKEQKVGECGSYDKKEIQLPDKKDSSMNKKELEDKISILINLWTKYWDYTEYWDYSEHHDSQPYPLKEAKLRKDYEAYKNNLIDNLYRDEWSKKAPDQVGWWIRMNVAHQPELYYFYEDPINEDKALCTTWGWGGEQGHMRVKDNLSKIEHFLWFGPLVIPPRQQK